ncbi:MAG: FAD/NAD(P)-binding protein [Anaerolineales bacterium]|nr:FAD/NAD(P)-binding protein [Anaerolineales bacterium]MCK5428421.1 FAD/NAD(P)-binding protein [Anaerolineales bacterium]
MKPITPVPTIAHQDEYLLAPYWAEVKDIINEAEGIATYWLEFSDREIQKSYSFAAGQFNMLYMPGYGEAAISISSDPERPERIGHTIRFVGNVTRAVSRLQVGQTVGLRGPFGTSWPLEAYKGNDVVIAAGGIGLAPLRPAIYQILNHRDDFNRVVILYGARTPEDLLYTSEYPVWQENGIEMIATVDRADESWHGQVGVVPMLFYRLQLDTQNTVVFSCGPEIMMRFVVFEGLARRIPTDRIYLSLERNMKCGQGFCGHCQFGPYFICKDGPVFVFDQLDPYFNLEDL